MGKDNEWDDVAGEDCDSDADDDDVWWRLSAMCMVLVELVMGMMVNWWR